MQVSVESVGNPSAASSSACPRATSTTRSAVACARSGAHRADQRASVRARCRAKVVEQRFGGQVRRRSSTACCAREWTRRCATNELRIAGAPEISQSDEAAEGELKYVAAIELVPDFGELDDGASSEVVRHTAEVTDADLERMLGNLRQQRASWTKVSVQGRRPCQPETASTVDGQRMPAEGAEKTSTVLGSGGSARKSSPRSSACSPRGEDHRRDPAGRLAHAAVRRQDRHPRPSLVWLTSPSRCCRRSMRPSSAASASKSGDLEQFKSEIRSNLQRRAEGRADEPPAPRSRRTAGRGLATSDVELPPRVVENEANALLANATEQARRQGQQVGAGVDAFRRPRASACWSRCWWPRSPAATSCASTRRA